MPMPLYEAKADFFRMLGLGHRDGVHVLGLHGRRQIGVGRAYPRQQRIGDFAHSDLRTVDHLGSTATNQLKNSSSIAVGRCRA